MREIQVSGKGYLTAKGRERARNLNSHWRFDPWLTQPQWGASLSLYSARSKRQNRPVNRETVVMTTVRWGDGRSSQELSLAAGERITYTKGTGMKRRQAGDLCLLAGVVGIVIGFFTSRGSGLQGLSSFEIAEKVIRTACFYFTLAAIVIGCILKYPGRFDR